jgi:hypothetical protein
MECLDVPAETLYDVLHDIEYRKKWDSNVIETFDIARLTVNADVGYYSCEHTDSSPLGLYPHHWLSCLFPTPLSVTTPMARLPRDLSAELKGKHKSTLTNTQASHVHEDTPYTDMHTHH